MSKEEIIRDIDEYLEKYLKEDEEYFNDMEEYYREKEEQERKFHELNYNDMEYWFI